MKINSLIAAGIIILPTSCEKNDSPSNTGELQIPSVEKRKKSRLNLDIQGLEALGSAAK